MLEDYKKLIFKIANSYCQNEEDQKDLTQEIVLQLWRAFPNYDPRYARSTWLYRIALNVSISFYRKQKKGKRIMLPGDSAILDLIDDRKDLKDPPADKIRQLHQFIAQLNSLDKALMILYLEEHSHKEIAHILGISKTNVGTKISRIKKKLRQHFQTLKN